MPPVTLRIRARLPPKFTATVGGCCAGTGNRLGEAGRLIRAPLPFSKVPIPHGESAVWLSPDEGRKLAPFRKLAPETLGPAGITVKLNGAEYEETLAVTVRLPGVDPA